jgi:ubiquitin-protein ligase
MQFVAPPSQSEARPGPSPRQRRLLHDWEALRAEYSGHPAVTVEPIGPLPPEEYRVTFHVTGLRREGDRPIVATEHTVRIQLPLGYPREAPYCTPLTPVFHPNIDEHFCIGDYWAAGEPLVDIVAKLGDMLQYRIYNTRSPLDAVAGRYADAHTELFPLGHVEIRAPDVAVASTAARSPHPHADPVVPPRDHRERTSNGHHSH